MVPEKKEVIQLNQMKYYPFVRNNYYSGKLMNVSVFESEQKYMNDKRRLHNRFVAGFGVICGLDTVAVSEESVSVEAGFAVDGVGREIVVSVPDVKRLSSLSGYVHGRASGCYYLYLQYAEQESDPVRTGTEQLDDVTYEKIKERYLLYLSDTCPSERNADVMYYYKHDQLILRHACAEVFLRAPKYIQANEKFLTELRIVPRSSDAAFHLKMRIDLKCVRYRGEDHIDIDFDSRTARDTDGVFVLRYICDAMNVVLDMAEFSVSCDRTSLQYNGEMLPAEDSVLLESVLTDRENAHSAMENYRLRILNDAEHSQEADVCLAKILLEGGKITQVVDFPLEQRVYTNSQLAMENEVLKDQVKILTMLYQNSFDRDSRTADSDNDVELASGETVINLGMGGKVGKRFFSEKISHGLGLGNVSIQLGLKDNDRKNQVVYGSGEIFDEDDKSVHAELAAKLNPAEGTFVIGLRLLQPTSAYEAVVHWTAWKKKESYHLDSDRKIVIDCGVKSLNVMESAYFSVKFVNMPKTDIHWIVESENGGTINDNGCYTAPSHAGVFKISAECVGDTSIAASAYIVVKP